MNVFFGITIQQMGTNLYFKNEDNCEAIHRLEKCLRDDEGRFAPRFDDNDRDC